MGTTKRVTPTDLFVQLWGREGLILVRNNKTSFLGMTLGWRVPSEPLKRSLGEEDGELLLHGYTVSVCVMTMFEK